jgi:hypothetical protein
MPIFVNRKSTRNAMPSNMQKAVFVYEVGKPVRLGEREIPSPKAGELLIKVTAAQGEWQAMYN